MRQRTCFHIPDQIGLRDEVLALGRVAIGRQRNVPVLCRGWAVGVHVHVDFIIIAIEHGAAEAQIRGKLTIQPQLCNLRFQPRAIDARNPEKLIAISGNRSVGLACSGGDRRNTSISGSIVVYIFIREPKPPGIAKFERDIRVPCISLAANEITVAIEIFINGIDPHGCAVTQWRIEVSRHIIRAKAVDAGLSCINHVISQRRFLDAVDDSAAAAATKYQRIRSFQDLDTFDII